MTAKCYDYNDNEIAYYVPCWESTNGEAVPCCNPMFNDSCASNGLCVTGVDTINPPYFFDGCTASGWTNSSIPGCPSTVCIPTGNNVVQACGNSLYCCYGHSGCDCNNASQVFSLDPVRLVTSMALTTSVAGTETTNDVVLTTSSSSNNAQVTPKTTTSSSFTNAQATPKTTASSSSASAQATPSSSSSGPNHYVTTGLGVGLGVGIPVAVAVAGSLWLLNRKCWGKQTGSPRTVVTQSMNEGAEWHDYGRPEMAMHSVSVNQPGVELQGVRGVELQAGQTFPRELMGDTNHRNEYPL
ncbi:hypothetical protein VM1G_10028 [Cytospora mali]|uniref:Uncharacterized protein n=1 Tax=Cytospora mali TaxID=578113 RepID=A0A194WDD8_CYTMA|nr:hypothetical protein VM1G_10028 [Valsa mali]